MTAQALLAGSAARDDLRTARVAVSAGDRPGAPCRVSVSSAHLAPRILGVGTAGARVGLLSTTATLLGGDAVRLSVSVGAGVRLDLVDIAGTVAYDGRGAPASWTVDLCVQAGGVLTWHGEAFVVADGAQVARSLTGRVQDGGLLLLRELMVLGRSGEVGGDLVSSTAVSYAGRPALVETLDLRGAGGGRSAAALRDLPGVLGGRRVIEALTAVGWRPPDGDLAATGGLAVGAVRLDLDAPGAVLRRLGDAGDPTSLAPAWSRWSAAIPAP